MKFIRSFPFCFETRKVCISKNLLVWFLIFLRAFPCHLREYLTYFLIPLPFKNASKTIYVFYNQKTSSLLSMWFIFTQNKLWFRRAIGKNVTVTDQWSDEKWHDGCYLVRFHHHKIPLLWYTRHMDHGCTFTFYYSSLQEKNLLRLPPLLLPHLKLFRFLYTFPISIFAFTAVKICDSRHGRRCKTTQHHIATTPGIMHSNHIYYVNLLSKVWPWF